MNTSTPFSTTTSTHHQQQPQQTQSTHYHSPSPSPSPYHHFNQTQSYHPTTTRQTSIKRPLPPVPPISSYYQSQSQPQPQPQSQPQTQTQTPYPSPHHFQYNQHQHHHPQPPNQFQSPNQFQPEHQHQQFQPPNQFHPPHQPYPHFQQNQTQWSQNQIRNPPSNHFPPSQPPHQVPLSLPSHPTNSISQNIFEQAAQQYYPTSSPIPPHSSSPTIPLSREPSTKYISTPFSPKRNLPSVPSSSPKPFVPIINSSITSNQRQDSPLTSISNRIARTGSLQGARPLINREDEQSSSIQSPNRMARTGSLQGARPLINREDEQSSSIQSPISSNPKPLPAPPPHPNPTRRNQEAQPTLTKPIKPSTPPTEPPGISISSAPEITITPNVPVLNIVGIDEESEDESSNESKPTITLTSTPDPSPIPIPVPIIVTEEEEPSTNPDPNETSLGETSIPVPSIITATDESPRTSNPISSSSKPQPIASSSTDPNQIQSLFCGGCHQIIAGRIVNALQKRWHPDCFKCEHCEMVLEHVAFYEHQGKAYCGVDYDEFFSLKCHHCNTSITDESYVTLDEPSLPDGPRHYHQLHLFCAECGDPFLNPKSLEESSRISKKSVTLNPSEEVKKKLMIEPNPFVLHKGYPYCEKCHLRLHKPKCFGCKLSMVGDIINAIGKQWHEDCFVCKDCKNPFLNGMFFLKDSNPFCEQCYSIQLKQAF